MKFIDLKLSECKLVYGGHLCSCLNQKEFGEYKIGSNKVPTNHFKAANISECITECCINRETLAYFFSFYAPGGRGVNVVHACVSEFVKDIMAKYASSGSTLGPDSIEANWCSWL